MTEEKSAAGDRTIIDLKSVTKNFGDFRALNSVSATINEGEFFSLLGPSGCGKTTLLRLIAGFDTPTSGSILIDGENMEGIPANLRPTNMVFQNYAIFPHLSVADNVSYGLKRKNLSKQDMARQVDEMLEMVDLSGYGHRSSHELSGGQRQRVALARALVMRPRVILLDEPLSALDKKLRDQMQVELRQLQRTVGITFILVTHDQEEALIMSDNIAVMFDGEIAQLASPEALYRHPVSRQVASFIGVMNFLPARATAHDDTSVTLDIAALGEVRVARSVLPAGTETGAIDTVGIRPEMLTVLFDDRGAAERVIEGTVAETSYYGDMTYYNVMLSGHGDPVTISMRNTAGRSIAQPGSTVAIGWGSESIVVCR